MFSILSKHGRSVIINKIINSMEINAVETVVNSIDYVLPKCSLEGHYMRRILMNLQSSIILAI